MAIRTRPAARPNAVKTTPAQQIAKPKTAAQLFGDELSSGRGGALRRNAAAMLGGGFSSQRTDVSSPKPPDTRSGDEIKAARNGSVQTAMDWARYQESAGGEGYDDKCLAFAINAYGVHSTPERCPELYNPPNGNAVGAWTALQENGKTSPPNPTEQLEEGALVFFAATEANEMDGHVCIATGRMAADGTPEVITSGYEGASGVHYSSVGTLSRESGAYLGYAEPSQAFAPGTSPDAAAANPAGDMPQGWNNTCGANVVLSMEAAVDPARAEELQALTALEHAQLEGATLRSDPENAGFALGQRPGGTTVGWGMFMMEQQVSERFGGDANAYTPSTRADAVTHLATELEAGRPVAIALDGHWMSATGVRDGEAGREFLVHDSWTGTSAWVPEATMSNTSANWVRTFFPDAPFNAAIRGLVSPGEARLNPDSTYRAAEPGLLAGVAMEQ